MNSVAPVFPTPAVDVASRDPQNVALTFRQKCIEKSSLLPLETAEVGQWEELRLFPGWERANVIWCG
jgi:hypothetical protein